MIVTARKHHLRFAALAFSVDIKLKLRLWKHPGIKAELYKKTCRRDSAVYLRLNHKVREVQDALNIANRRTVVIRKPHHINPYGIGRKICGYPACVHDRSQLGCDNPGE
ncbi:hypothetical protein C8R45DRAFT_839979 [Mycena sanguinolenta]|nr:hypothetical protein C8R45DRAFT_839979 [Mycena sanguinolenta]